MTMGVLEPLIDELRDELIKNNNLQIQVDDLEAYCNKLKADGYLLTQKLAQAQVDIVALREENVKLWNRWNEAEQQLGHINRTANFATFSGKGEFK